LPTVFPTESPIAYSFAGYPGDIILRYHGRFNELISMVSFVILHYLNTEDTIACIESIRNHVIFPEYSLVLVDNASPNHSGEILAARYEKTPDIHLLRLKKNLGFAEGNNAGYQYARNVLNSNFILVINNDTIIEQPDFIKLITEKYDQFQYDILGPDIISLKDNSHQNRV
jgi:GT2 family glycosyltransferase